MLLKNSRTTGPVPFIIVLQVGLKGTFICACLPITWSLLLREKLKPLLFMDEYQDKSRQSSPVRKVCVQLMAITKQNLKSTKKDIP